MQHYFNGDQFYETMLFPHLFKRHKFDYDELVDNNYDEFETFNKVLELSKTEK